MPGNTSPIFSKVAHVEWVNGVAAANTAKDGSGTVDTVFTADATNGSYLHKLVVRPRGSNVATVLRVFLNNGSSNAVAANNALIGEMSITATTNSETAAIAGYELPLNIPVPPGHRVLVTLGTAVAGGHAVTAFGGDY